MESILKTRKVIKYYVAFNLGMIFLFALGIILFPNLKDVDRAHPNNYRQNHEKVASSFGLKAQLYVIITVRYQFTPRVSVISLSPG